MRALLFLVAVLLPLAGAGAARAEADAGAYERVHFAVERARDVANDRVRADLVAEREGDDPLALAAGVNETMAWALERAKGAPAVTGRTGSYQTFPRHRGEDDRDWVVSQELVLESGDVEALRSLLGELQTKLQLRGMSFEPSDEARRAAEDALIEEALAAFAQRAERIREALGFDGWRIVSLQVGPEALPPPQPRFGRQMVAMEAQAAPPALASGESRIEVRVHGEIELRR